MPVGLFSVCPSVPPECPVPVGTTGGLLEFCAPMGALGTGPGSCGRAVCALKR